MTREGGCFCGAVRYRLAVEPVDVTHCHCLHCRRTSAAAFVTWATVPDSGFQFTKGSARSFSSRPGAVRTFCGDCGTPLTFRGDQSPDMVDVTACSLDEPETLQPVDHVFNSRRLPWLRMEDGLPVFPRSRRG
jgi:hypothetical protein